MRRTTLRSVVPAVLVWAATSAWGQVEKEEWQIWYSKTLGVSFLALGTPVEEIVEFSGPLAEKVQKCVGIGFNSGDAELSVYRLTLKPNVQIGPAELIDLRTALAKEKAPDFKVRQSQEWPDSDYPCVQTWVEYTGPDGGLVSRRLFSISCDKGTWLVEANNMATSEAREAANKLFDSVRMDPESKIKPGTKKQ